MYLCTMYSKFCKGERERERERKREKKNYEYVILLG